MLSVSAVKLHECTLKDQSKSWSKVTVFPFFRNTGEVTRHMLVVPEGDLALWVDNLDQLKVSISGKVTLDGLVANLPSVMDHNMGAMEKEWHFDPWWLLLKPAYVNRNWVPAAGASNCTDAFEGLYYNSHLKTVTTVVPPGGSADAPQKYTQDMLAVTREKVEMIPSGKNRSNGGWRIKETWPAFGSWKQF